jgi:hypothetical protein
MCENGETCGPCMADRMKAARKAGMTEADALLVCSALDRSGENVTGVSACATYADMKATAKARLDRKLKGPAARLRPAVGLDPEPEGKALLDLCAKADTHDPVGKLAKAIVLDRVPVLMGRVPFHFSDTLEAKALDLDQLTVGHCIEKMRPIAAKVLSNHRKAKAVADVRKLDADLGALLGKEPPAFTKAEIERHTQEVDAAERNARMGYDSWAEVDRLKAAGPQRAQSEAEPIDSRAVNAIRERNLGMASAAEVDRVKAEVLADGGRWS